MFVVQQTPTEAKENENSSGGKSTHSSNSSRSSSRSGRSIPSIISGDTIIQQPPSTAAKDEVIASLKREMAARDREMAAKDEIIASLKREIAVMYHVLEPELGSKEEHGTASGLVPVKSEDPKQKVWWSFS